MNDRELLELAAKAAGNIQWDRSGLSPVFIETKDGALSDWNPLTDDGDALRLAVKLGLLVDCDYYLKESEAMGRGAYQVVEHEDDPYAATRSAIVRAAAEIGRSMP